MSKRKIMHVKMKYYWREEIFFELSRVLSKDTLWVKNFVEIALSRTV